ncbi:MAG: O-antigen ligase family protein [Solirubrobacteraceae bacterium]
MNATLRAANAPGRRRKTAQATFGERLFSGLPALAPALVAVALMILWAAHDGGYDDDTWYWGALTLLAVVAVMLITLGPRRTALSRASIVALVAFAGYLGWSYLSMAWAQTPGWALEGSNRTLLYLLVFVLFLIVPWTPEAALVTILVFVLGVGMIAIVLLSRFALRDHAQTLFIDGRLAAPTGYFNSSVALFMINTLLATMLASRRTVPAPLRGLLIAIACASLQLCVMGQSRGWLFTLPLVLVVAVLVARERLRLAAAATLPIAAALLPVHRLLDVFQTSGARLDRAATTAGRTSLLLSAGMLVLGTLIAKADTKIAWPSPSPAGRRRLGAVVAALALVGAGAGAIAATHGDPLGFVGRQWRGFVHPPATTSTVSHFAAVGSGRYDFWRVGLDAFVAHPIGGLGQDNFADYYLPRARSGEDPRWTHSLEIRLLTHTGIVGFALFATFLTAAVAAALPALRRGTAEPSRAVAATALLALVVWLIHGSVDWFWEIPALTAPALGFLGMAGALGCSAARTSTPRRALPRLPRAVTAVAGSLAFMAAAFVLALAYLSVREVSVASDIRQRNPTAALADLATAADLNPLSPDPGRLAGTIALQNGALTIAEQRFRQTIAREPGGWYAWFGDGLAASGLGDGARAHHDFVVAASINPRSYAVAQALSRVYSSRPMTPTQAFGLLVLEL